jgi:hypothetical protein
MDPKVGEEVSEVRLIVQSRGVGMCLTSLINIINIAISDKSNPLICTCSY